MPIVQYDPEDPNRYRPFQSGIYGAELHLQEIALKKFRVDRFILTTGEYLHEKAHGKRIYTLRPKVSEIKVNIFELGYIVKETIVLLDEGRFCFREEPIHGNPPEST